MFVEEACSSLRSNKQAVSVSLLRWLLVHLLAAMCSFLSWWAAGGAGERPTVQPVALLSDQPRPRDSVEGKGRRVSRLHQPQVSGSWLQVEAVALCLSPALSLCGREACPPILGPGLITPFPPNKVRTKM